MSKKKNFSKRLYKVKVAQRYLATSNDRVLLDLRADELRTQATQEIRDRVDLWVMQWYLMGSYDTVLFSGGTASTIAHDRILVGLIESDKPND